MHDSLFQTTTHQPWGRILCCVHTEFTRANYGNIFLMCRSYGRMRQLLNNTICITGYSPCLSNYFNSQTHVRSVTLRQSLATSKHFYQCSVCGSHVFLPAPLTVGTCGGPCPDYIAQNTVYLCSSLSPIFQWRFCCGIWIYLRNLPSNIQSHIMTILHTPLIKKFSKLVMPVNKSWNKGQFDVELITFTARTNSEIINSYNAQFHAKPRDAFSVFINYCYTNCISTFIHHTQGYTPYMRDFKRTHTASD